MDWTGPWQEGHVVRGWFAFICKHLCQTISIFRVCRGESKKKYARKRKKSAQRGRNSWGLFHPQVTRCVSFAFNYVQHGKDNHKVLFVHHIHRGHIDGMHSAQGMPPAAVESSRSRIRSGRNRSEQGVLPWWHRCSSCSYLLLLQSKRHWISSALLYISGLSRIE